MDETQFGFRNALGTREALWAINVMLQKCRDQRKDIFACFIDYEKAFDMVKPNDLIKMLKEKQLDSKDVNIITNLYWKQKAGIVMGDAATKDVDIQSGVRQGCVLSPLLCNLYSDAVFKTLKK